MEMDDPKSQVKIKISDITLCYFQQFQKDFGLFLKSRSVELTIGATMFLTMLGRQSQDHTDGNKRVLWEALAESFSSLVSQVCVVFNLYLLVHYTHTTLKH